MSSFFRTGSDLSAGMANTSDLEGDSLIEFNDHARDNWSITASPSPHQTVIDKLTRDKLWAEGERRKVIGKDDTVLDPTRLHQMNAAILEAQMGIDYEIARAAETNQRAAEDNDQVLSDLEEQAAHQKAVFADLESARKKRMFG